MSDTEAGNGQLTYPIGLLTADEVILAGGHGTTTNQNYYLYINNNYWLVSPSLVNDSQAFGFIVNSSGALNLFFLNVAVSGVRPVISLSSDLSVSGTGHWNDPYIVDM